MRNSAQDQPGQKTVLFIYCVIDNVKGIPIYGYKNL